LWEAVMWPNSRISEEEINRFLDGDWRTPEYIFTPVLWPDFGPDALRDALAEYAGRRRRFGRR